MRWGSPNREWVISQNAHKEVPSILGIGGNPQNLVGSMSPIYLCKESRSQDHGNIQKVVPRVQTVMVCLLTYISIKCRYSRVTITIVPSVACQHTEGEYHLLTTTTYTDTL